MTMVPPPLHTWPARDTRDPYANRALPPRLCLRGDRVAPADLASTFGCVKVGLLAAIHTSHDGEEAIEALPRKGAGRGRASAGIREPVRPGPHCANESLSGAPSLRELRGPRLVPHPAKVYHGDRSRRSAPSRPRRAHRCLPGAERSTAHVPGPTSRPRQGASRCVQGRSRLMISSQKQTIGTSVRSHTRGRFIASRSPVEGGDFE